MNVISMACTSCGAPIQIPPDIDQLTCAHCGVSLFVQRGEGYVALKVAEQLSKAIKDSARETNVAIGASTAVTQAELKRLQSTQELSTATTQLGNIQAQIRYLQSQKQNRKIKKELTQLREIEEQTLQQIMDLRDSLEPVTFEQAADENSTDPKEIVKAKRMSFSFSGCLASILTFIAGLYVLYIVDTIFPRNRPTVLSTSLFIAVVIACLLAYVYIPKTIRKRVGNRVLDDHSEEMKEVIQ